jgi:hypothetical protein
MSRTPSDDQVSSTDNRDREPVLLLYYRWALQSLAMLAFLHEQGVYLMDFSSKTIWIREDLSIALSGFVNATIPTDEWPYSPDGTRYEAEIYYPIVPENGFPELTPKIDLSDWATFVWHLMRTDTTRGAKRWPLPTDPLDETEVPGEENLWEYHTERLKEGKLQLLEEERLGPILVKAWKGEYENAREIMHEVRSYLEQIEVQMEGEDEVLLDHGGKWEDVFAVVQTDGVRWGREIRYR